MRVEYIKGDATAPTAAGNKIIVHICNDIGAWGKGFVMAISKKWKEPAKQYKAWYKSQDGFGLAGGTWDKIEPLLKECMVSKGVQVTVYDF